jgi:predicted N-formylglutamate amidohydrolase
MSPSSRLITADDLPPVSTIGKDGKSPFFLVCDHAGNEIPRSLNALGLHDSALQRHIAWDIGAAGVTGFLVGLLDAFAVLQTYSRLVIDCNRPPASDESIAETSEDTRIPGNEFLPQAQRDARLRDVFVPYHERVRRELDQRIEAGRPVVLISMHSFTPVFRGVRRPWDIGILYNRDARTAEAMMTQLRQDIAQVVVVGDNQPYAVDDESDYTLPVHGEQRGLPHLGIELRQDLISDKKDQELWAGRLAPALVSSWQAISL